MAAPSLHICDSFYLCTGLLSKVSVAVQHLDISSNNQEGVSQQEASYQLSTSPDSVLEPGSTSSPPRASDTPTQQTPSQAQASQQPEVPDSSQDWQRASSSHNAARKKKRKQQRRAASQPEPVSSPPSARASASSAEAVLPPSTVSTQADQVVYASSSGDVVTSNAEDQTAARSLHQGAAPTVTVVTSNPTVSSQHDESVPSALGHDSADSEAESAVSVDGLGSDTSASQCGESAAQDSQVDEQSSDEEEPNDEATFQSSVASVTADFAMQNVILQMGLRLVAPNGMRIKQLSRWVLRCSACFKITKVGSFLSPARLLLVQPVPPGTADLQVVAASPLLHA